MKINKKHPFEGIYLVMKPKRNRRKNKGYYPCYRINIGDVVSFNKELFVKLINNENIKNSFSLVVKMIHLDCYIVEFNDKSDEFIKWIIDDKNFNILDNLVWSNYFNKENKS